VYRGVSPEEYKEIYFVGSDKNGEEAVVFPAISTDERCKRSLKIRRRISVATNP
jgi:hypothetical protein